MSIAELREMPAYRRGFGLLVASELGDLLVLGGYLAVLQGLGVRTYPRLQDIMAGVETIARYGLNCFIQRDRDRETEAPALPARMVQCAKCDALATGLLAGASLMGVMCGGGMPGLVFGTILTLGKVIQFYGVRLRTQTWNDMVDQASTRHGERRNTTMVRTQEGGLMTISPLLLRFVGSGLIQKFMLGGSPVALGVSIALIVGGGLIGTIAKTSFARSPMADSPLCQPTGPRPGLSSRDSEAWPASMLQAPTNDRESANFG